MVELIGKIKNINMKANINKIIEQLKLQSKCLFVRSYMYLLKRYFDHMSLISADRITDARMDNRTANHREALLLKINDRKKIFIFVRISKICLNINNGLKISF